MATPKCQQPCGAGLSLQLAPRAEIPSPPRHHEAPPAHQVEEGRRAADRGLTSSPHPALACAARTSANYVGPVRRNPYKGGDLFTVPKGANVLRDGKMVAMRRTCQVQLVSTFDGYVSVEYGKVRVVHPSVTWAGHSGVWCHLDISNVPHRPANFKK